VARERAHVQHQLFCRESEQGTGAGVARRGGAENDGHQGRKRSRISARCPWNEVLDILALRGGEDREEESRRRLAPIARGGNNAQRATSDPAAATFVAERRAPAPAAHDLAGGTAAVRNRPGSGDEQNPGAILEGIVHRDHPVRIDHDFLGKLPGVERRVEGAALFVSGSAGNAAVENTGKYRARLRDFG